MRPGPVYPITAQHTPTGLSHIQQAQLFLEAGIRFFQVREKGLADKEYVKQLFAIRKLANYYEASFVVNDRVDLALVSGADGVHLGQDDLPIGLVRKILGPEAVIGLSSHTLQQFREALLEEIDYVACGPIFPTQSKESEFAPLGTEFLRKVSVETELPIVGIGGITLSNAGSVWTSGASSVAVISDVAQAEYPKKRLQQYLEAYA